MLLHAYQVESLVVLGYNEGRLNWGGGWGLQLNEPGSVCVCVCVGESVCVCVVCVSE